MLRTPLKPYSPSEEEGQHKHKSRRKGKTSSHRPEAEGGTTSGEEEDSSSGSSCDSPTGSPHPQRSSSDGGSDLEELLTKDFPHEDLPSLITRAMGKGGPHCHQTACPSLNSNLGGTSCNIIHGLNTQPARVCAGVGGGQIDPIRAAVWLFVCP